MNLGSLEMGGCGTCQDGFQETCQRCQPRPRSLHGSIEKTYRGTKVCQDRGRADRTQPQKFKDLPSTWEEEETSCLSSPGRVTKRACLKHTCMYSAEIRTQGHMASSLVLAPVL